MIAKFPELAKYSPPEEWLSHSAERLAVQEELLKAKRDANKQKRIDEENDKSWTEGMAAATLNDTHAKDTMNKETDEEKGEEKGEEKKE